MSLIRSHLIEQQVERKGSAEDALVAFGGVGGGYSMYIKDDKLQYVQNYVARDYLHVESTVPAGHHELRFEFEVTGAAGLRPWQGHAGPRTALHQRPARRPGRFPAHHAFRPGADGRHLHRSRSRCASRAFLQDAL